MNKKTYTSKSVAVVMIQLGNGLSAQVSFLPLIEGGSEFVTTDEMLQDALESHPMYDKLFSLGTEEMVVEAITAPKPKYYGPMPGAGGVGHVVNVVDVDDDITADESPAVGEEIGVIYDNVGEESYTVTISADDYRTPDGNDIELDVPVGGYAEASFLNVNGVIYARGC